MTIYSNSSEEQHQVTEVAKQTIEQFIADHDESYRQLAYYAALPLLLTPELLNYLRNRFLRGQTPWVAEIDLLLNLELCRPVDYELYSMRPEVRAYLLAEIREKLGVSEMQRVARTLIHYVRHLARTNAFLADHELQAQQWAAMVYLDDQRPIAVHALAESFRAAAVQMQSSGAVITIAARAELTRLARLTAMLAPELTQYPELIEYAELIGRLLAGVADDLPESIQRNYRVTVEGVTLHIPDGVVAPRRATVESEPSTDMQEAIIFDLAIEVINTNKSSTPDVYRVTGAVPQWDLHGVSEFKLPYPLSEFITMFEHAIVDKSLPEMRRLGGALFEAVFIGEIRKLWTRCQEAVTAPSRQFIRVLLHLQSIDELTYLPWEYLYDAQKDIFLALHPQSTFARYYNTYIPETPPAVLPLLSMLVVLAAPSDYPALDMEQEWTILQEAFRLALDEIGQRDSITLDRISTPTLHGLQDLLHRKKYHVLYLVGYTVMDEQGDEALVLLDEAGKSAPVAAKQLGELLRAHPSIRLCLFSIEASTTQQSMITASGVRLAQVLVKAGLAAAITAPRAMNSPFNSRIVYPRLLLSCFDRVYPVDVAIAETRQSLFSWRTTDGWGLPVLTMSTHSGVLFTVKEKSIQPPVMESDSPISFDWITIPAGAFLMGSDKFRDKQAIDVETPQHQLTLPAYSITRMLVTNAQYKLFVDSTKHTPPQHWNNGRIPAGKENHPVVYVSWRDAQAFCRWAGVRLPTEAEWEKAARGPDKRIWPWGNESPTDRRCNFNGNVGDTTPVGRYPDGASPFGVLDMAGNVWEWTSSLYKPYPYDLEDGREAPTLGSTRTVRGGSWSNRANLVRCAYRRGDFPDYWQDYLGFRVASSNV